MVLSEGKGVGQGSRAASILQPFPLLSLQTSKPIRSPPGPGPDPVLALGDGETGTSSSVPRPMAPLETDGS